MTDVIVLFCFVCLLLLLLFFFFCWGGGGEGRYYIFINHILQDNNLNVRL